MKKPQIAKKRKASQKRATKKGIKDKKRVKNKQVRLKERKNVIITQQRKFNNYLSNLLGNPGEQQSPQE